MKKISILIPVLRESKLLAPLLNKLIEDHYKNKEIIVAIDEPTENSLEVFRKYKDKVKFIINKKREGKAKALNKAAKCSTGDILLFLDSDIKIKNKNFLGCVVNEMRYTDILEFKKKIIKDGFIPKVAYHEFINSNFISLYLSKVAQKSPFLCGAAFATKRDVFMELNGFSNALSEDFDFATRSMIKNKAYKYSNELEVYTKAPNNWKDWLQQRKRWMVGFILWIKKYWKIVPKKCPYLIFPLVYSLFPMLILFFVNFLLFPSLLDKLILTILILLPIKFTQLIPAVFLIFSTITILRAFFLYVVTFILSIAVTYIVSKIIKFKFNISYFLFCYFIFSPLMVSIFLFYFFKIMFSNKLNYEEMLDWKI